MAFRKFEVFGREGRRKVKLRKRIGIEVIRAVLSLRRLLRALLHINGDGFPLIYDETNVDMIGDCDFVIVLVMNLSGSRF